jgi:hypothetical protein
MDRMAVKSFNLLELMTELLSRLAQAMLWLGKQSGDLEIDVPRHLEETVRIGHRDAPPCLLMRKEPTDDEALFEVLRLVLGAMSAQKPAPRRAVAKPGSRKRRS